MVTKDKSTNMEKITFAGKTSAKNIPIPPEKEYRKCLVAKIESFLHRILWRAYFVLGYHKAKMEKDDIDEEEANENFGFKSGKNPPKIKELDAFVRDVLDIVNKVTFRNKPNKFQRELNINMKKMKETSSIIIGADKSMNFYKTGYQKYQKLLNDNVTKEYKKEKKKN